MMSFLFISAETGGGEGEKVKEDRTREYQFLLVMARVGGVEYLCMYLFPILGMG